MHSGRGADRLTRALRDGQHGRYAQAETGFREILLSQPGNVDAKFGLATVLAAGGRLAEAIGLFREVLHARPDHITALINLGNALLQYGNYRDAEQAYRAALKLQPDASAAIYGLGCALQYADRSAEAEACFRRSLRDQPDNPGLLMNLGTACMQQRKLDDAIGFFLRATQLKADLHQGWTALGQALLDTNRSQEAEQAFRHAIQLAPQSAAAHIGLGDALSAREQNEAALKSYFDAIAHAPDSQNAHTKVESLLLRMTGAADDRSVLARLLGDHVYDRPRDSLPDALALLDAYTYPYAEAIDESRTFLLHFDPEELYPGTWWKERLSHLATTAGGHDKVLRGISSAIYSWSPPSREAVEAVAFFAGDSVVHSFGAGTGYWEWLLTRHSGKKVLAGDRVLRHRFVEMAVEDYGTATVGEDETVFLAWIPRGVEAVLNLFQQMRAEQKLVIVGEGPDAQGKARICASEKVFRYLETAFEQTARVPLGYYSYIRDDVRMYRKR
jgi:cytochrome c-type biogenesis protein CcmH/NrfG